MQNRDLSMSQASLGHMSCKSQSLHSLGNVGLEDEDEKIGPVYGKIVLRQNRPKHLHMNRYSGDFDRSNKDITIAIPNMPQEDAESILKYWLQHDNRELTQHQFDVIIKAYNKCSLPLYLKLAFMESKSWSSFTEIENCKLSETITKLAAFKFGKLESKHGEPLVRRALGYITASREGIASIEMEDILSLDEAVMDDVMANYRPSKRRCPSVLWIRLLEDLSDRSLKCIYCDAFQQNFLVNMHSYFHVYITHKWLHTWTPLQM